jgi:hypothetical protein
MKKNLVFLYGMLLLLVALLVSGVGIGVPREQDIQSEVNKTSPLAVLSIPNDDYILDSSTNNTVILKNPTFQEMRDFLLNDTTSRKTFVLYTYECRHFATEVNNNAKAAGWQCGFALLCYARGQHAVVVFNTTDRGLIFIEPQTDAAIDVTVGGTYQQQEIKEILIAW